MNIAAVIQARTNSSRFPGKCLAPICGRPMLDYVVGACQAFTKAIVAIPVGDMPLINWCTERKVDFFQGSEENLLYRYYKCAKQFSLDRIIRITGDCPFLQATDLCTMIMICQTADFVSNCVHFCIDGFEIEIMSFKALEWAFNQTKDPYDQEHVTAYFKRDEERFNRAGFRMTKHVPGYNPAWFPKL